MKVQGQRQSSGCMSSIDAQANHNKTIIAQLLTSKKIIIGNNKTIFNCSNTLQLIP